MSVFLFAFWGIIAGVCWNVETFFVGLFNRNKIAVLIKDIIFSPIVGFLLIFCIFYICKGCFNIFDIIGFFIGFFIELISIGNLFDYFSEKLYNKLKKNFLARRDKKYVRQKADQHN